MLVAASSLAASLLGRQAFDDLDPIVLALLALVAFIVSLTASLYLLTPRTRFIFSLDGPVLYEDLYQFRDDVPEVHRRLTSSKGSGTTTSASSLRSSRRTASRPPR